MSQFETKHESTYIAVGSADDFTLGKGKRVNVNGKTIAVWHLEDGFYAIDDACPHQGASLAFGLLEGKTVACPRHGSEFHLATGEVKSLPSTCGVNAYNVIVEGGIVKVSIEPRSKEKPSILRL